MSFDKIPVPTFSLETMLIKLYPTVRREYHPINKFNWIILYSTWLSVYYNLCDNLTCVSLGETGKHCLPNNFAYSVCRKL